MHTNKTRKYNLLTRWNNCLPFTVLSGKTRHDTSIPYHKFRKEEGSAPPPKKKKKKQRGLGVGVEKAELHQRDWIKPYKIHGRLFS